MDPSKIREKIGRFRILVIGRANAGKTTILQRVCNTRDDPEIYNGAGEKINATVLNASRERGEHEIENEMVFQSNPGFVFHDSRGFEAGGESEFDEVKAFIADRSKETKLKDQLHVIWYCIPMDGASRSFTEGEKKFSLKLQSSVPVMVLFTKFDALYDVAYAGLKSKGASLKDAKEQAPKHAEESFAKGPQLKFINDVRWPPKCHVCLPNMDKNGADCGPLIERTAGTLDNEVLQQLFVSTQQINLDLSVKYAIQITLQGLFNSAEAVTSQGHEKMIRNLGAWFPHIYVRLLESSKVALIYVERLLAGTCECVNPPSSSSHTDRSRFPLFAPVSVSILLQSRPMLIELITHSSQPDVSVLILLRARPMLIEVIAHSSQDSLPTLRSA
ncbi:hypothetical protein F4604DRAFT_2012120 [Suillus subluteus]|nr:hypothetical protein F4604DRAFT_2012120 [Suillus subluteus]